MLELKNINAYYGESHILRNVAFTIDPGEVVCLMGRNGVGKTVCCRLDRGKSRSTEPISRRSRPTSVHAEG
jgi:ABC-type branched-subunit amino acid transport system ATPase component